MMKRTLQALLIVFFLMTGVLSGSCDEDDTTVIAELLRTWMLQSFGKIDEERPLIQDTEITLEFDDENKIRGTAGCNYYFGTYDAKGDGTVSFKQLAMTEMACISPEGVMEQENRYLEVLAGVSAYEVKQDRLQLFYDEGQSVLNYSMEPGEEEKRKRNGNN